MGTLGDHVGRAVILRFGLVVFALASLGAVFSISPAHLIAARVAMGAGAASIIPSTLAIITHIFPDDERGKAIGMWGAMNGIGIAIGPLLGGLLLKYFSWSAIFLINIPIVLTALVAGWFLVPNSRNPSPQQPDIPGTVLSAAATWLLIFGLIKAGDWGWFHHNVWFTLTGFVFLAAAFVVREKTASAPMMDLRLFNNSRLSAGSGCIVLMATVMFGMLFILTMFMQFVKQYSAMETGIRFLPIALGYAMGSVSGNRFVYRWGTAKVVATGFITMAAVGTAIAFWQAETPYWMIGILLFAFSYSMGNIMTPSLNAVLGAVPKAHAGVGSAISNVSFQIGGALGVAALGSILSTIYKNKISVQLDAWSQLSQKLLSPARESIGKAIAVAGQLPEAWHHDLVQTACECFMDGWQVVLFIVIGLGLIGAVFAMKFSVGR